ncbi:hypothetical protein NCLIV_015430 [Neospora caninum Liverpool]|uniref:Thioredoxin-like protein n=1 Tax=Neospora caninum (strain Liverpool) TaxID=572307 RepID=F0VDF8_NEOCL|nr:hypothetical protein NCLIV_015430 [Neospora caninum Liverpool]CBZ51751.1 hypothetical protein NCLIV_015430 [Neospora caninum Liverpool]CEL65706.1 TPA: Thioredoxin-like protein [Neospora caninum Liverpool]|eukprot:XP_003881784.1 hypothetical protein NCLIV_015430 [Neospora caninum Liverpool]
MKAGRPVTAGSPGPKAASLARRRSGVAGCFSRASAAFKRLRRYLTVSSLSLVVLLFALCYYVVQRRLLSASHLSFVAEGPGMHPGFNVPSRFFSLSLHSDKGALTEGEKQALSSEFSVSWSTTPRLPGGAKLSSQVVSRQDGTFLFRFSLHDAIPAGHTLSGKVLYAGKKPDRSIVEPFVFKMEGPIHPATCRCPENADAWKQALSCPRTLPRQLERDISKFPVVDLARLRKDGPAFAAPNTLRTVVHYVVKDNQIFRRHFGPLPGFQYFIDNVLLYLAAAVKLPDVEFFMNLGDWPLEKRNADEGGLPLFSWSGSDDTFDIILPQWDVAKTSTVGLGKSQPDLLTIQARSGEPLAKRIPKALFRGRDSNSLRVKLAELAQKHDILDVAITSWENDTYAEQEKKLGGGYKSRIPLEKFGEYKYQLLVDGSVAPFRTPYLLMTGSLPLKHESRYYEWFYGDLKAGVHYLPFKNDLSDLVDQLKWAEEHPVEAQAIADRARQYAQEHLVPNKIFCYYFQALEVYASRQKGTPTVADDMVKVDPTTAPPRCACEAEPRKDANRPYPLVQLYSGNIANVLEKEKVVVIASYSSFCNKSSSFLPKFLKAARAFADKKAPVTFALADGLTNRYPEPFDFCNYKSQPRVLVLPPGHDREKVQVMEDALTVYNTVEFVAKHVAAEFRPTVPEDLAEVMSQAVPEDNSKPVKVVVGNTFDSIVFNEEKDVLLEIYAPWCGHCKNLKPTYEEFARLASLSPSAKSLVVAKMDGTENSTRHKAFSWSAYPTILFIKAGSRTPIPFSGPRTLRGFYDFIVKHGSNPALDIAGIPPPEVDVFSGPSAATVVNAANFDKIVNGDKDVLLEVYAPWCGHCKRLQPVYEAFATAAAKSPSARAHLVVAKMDGTETRPSQDDFKITGFPTIWFIKKGSGKPIKHTGGRSARDLLKFVQEHATSKIEVELPPEEPPKPLSQSVPTDNSGPVKVIVRNTFEKEVLQSDKDVLLEVYAPWCGHCKKLEPVYEAFAREAAKSATAAKNLVVAKMDGTQNTLDNPEFKWTGFPTIWFIKKGSGKPIKHSGGRSARDLLKFVQEHATSKIEVELPPEEPPKPLSQSVPTDNSGPVKVIVRNTFEKEVLQSDKDVLLKVYAPWCGHCKKLEPVYEAFAREAAKSATAAKNLVVAKMDGTQNTLDNPEFKWTGFPTIWFIKKGSGKPIKHTGGRSARDLLKFVQEHATSKIEVELPPEEPPKPLSQSVPTDNSGPVKVIVRNTFEKEVLQSDKDVLLEVYAPWCGHCKKLEPVYEAFAREAAKSATAAKNLVVAKMDGTQNMLDNPEFKWTGFPTIWFIKKGSGKPIKHTGGRSARDLLKFVQEHATSKIEVELPPEEPPKPLSQSVPTDNSGPVKVIVRNTFEKEVLQSDKVYAPWCGHCKKLEPVYEAFAREAAKSATAAKNLVVAKMDGTQNTLDNPEFKWTGFPTIWFIKKGSGKPIKHTGGRSARDLLKFVQEHATSKIEVELPPAEPPKPLSQSVPTDNSGPVKVIVRNTFEKEVLQSDKVYAPWCGHCKKLEPVYEAFAREAAKSATAAKNLVVAKMDGTQNTLDNPEFKWTGFPTIWFIKKGSGKPIKHTGGRSARDLLKFVQEHATSKIEVELPPEEPPKPLSQSVPTDNSGPVKVIVRNTFEKEVLQSDKVYAPWCGHCKKLEPVYEAFAREAAKSATAAKNLVVAKMDGTQNTLDNPEFKWTGFPTIWFIKKGSGKPIKHTGGRSARDLLKFVQEHATSKIEVELPPEEPPKPLSQSVPTDNSGPVKVIVRNTFEKEVLQSDKDVLLEVYAPWCGHCKKLEPVYEAFAREAAKSATAAKNLVVAKMDGTQNTLDNPEFKWTGFPTIWLVRKGSGKPIEFNGVRTVDGLREFVVEHASVSGMFDSTRDEL